MRWLKITVLGRPSDTTVPSVSPTFTYSPTRMEREYMRLTMGSGLLRTAWGNAVCVTIPAPPACKAVARAIAARRTRSAGVSPAGWPAGLPPAVVELQVCRGSRQRHIELPGGRGESPIHHLLRMHRTCHAARHCPRPKRTQGSKKHTHGGLLRVHRALPAHKLDDRPLAKEDADVRGSTQRKSNNIGQAFRARGSLSILRRQRRNDRLVGEVSRQNNIVTKFHLYFF